jgi:cyanophycinase-like exopeptidase
MKKSNLLLGLLLVIQLVINAQSLPGSIMIVGGGSESDGGWSDEPYSWAVSQAENSRVAIIGASSDPSDWLPNYFMNTCGADFAKNFIIASSSVADLQETYDSLVTYNMIFFRGGDQYDYYSDYKNTKTQDAVIDVFNNGGVISGTSAGLHIISEVVFTAQNGTVYPEEAIENPYNQYMTLENDFLALVPGMVFDSHVAERARFARTIGFVGRWEMDHEPISGIAVDDKTAFCIGADMVGTCYGTGAVGIYRSGENNNYRVSGEKLLADNVEVTQLINNTSIQLNDLSVSGFSETTTTQNGEAYNVNTYLSGSNELNKNTQMLDEFLNQNSSNENIIILTKVENATVTQFADYLSSNGGSTEILETSITNGSSPAISELISQAEKVLILENTYINLYDFMNGTDNGSQLINRIRYNGMVTAFVGSDSRFAGKSVVYNYEEEYASYYGELEFRNGLEVLANTVIMPQTFSSDIDNENAATSIPYALVNENIKYGVWLFDDAVAHFEYWGADLRLSSMGDFPMILAKNEGGAAQLTDQSVSGSGTPRNIAGFEKFTYRLIDQTTYEIIDLVGSVSQLNANKVSIIPNPSSDFIQIELPGNFKIRIFNTLGELLKEELIQSNSIISVSDLASGVYMISIIDENQQVFQQKLIKQ